MKAAPILNSFNGGEYSRSLDGRTDIAKYASGCKLLQNFIPLVQGPAMRRGGTRFVKAVKNSTDRTWLGHFEFSATQAFILEFGHLYIRFYTLHGVLLSGPDPYEIVSPYTAADLTTAEGECTLCLEQSGDVIYIANLTRRYAPRKLTRLGNTNWTLTTYNPDTGPYLERPVAGSTAAVYCSAVKGSITIKSAESIFAATDVGRLIRIDAQNLIYEPWEPAITYTKDEIVRSDGKTYKALNGAVSGTNTPVHESGSAYDGKNRVQWEFQDAGYGTARITAFTDAKTVTAKTILQMPASTVGISKAITAATKALPCVLTIVGHNFNSGDYIAIAGIVGMTQLNDHGYAITPLTADTVALNNVDSTGYTTYVSGGTAETNASNKFQLGAWSDSTEYPGVVAFFRDRLAWAGKTRYWLSVVDDFDDMSADFAGVVRADNAIYAQIQSQDVNEILWIVEADSLIIGTQGGEFAIAEITESAPLGPANIKAKKQSKRRSRAVKPVTVGTSVCYVQRAGRKLMSMDFSFATNRYNSQDMAVLAERITRAGIVGMVYQAEPVSVIWCWLTDGSFRGFTIDTDQQVQGWHRHPIGGGGIVESCEVIPSPSGDRDEIWMIVRRTINGQSVRYIEYMERPWEGPDEDGTGGDAQADAFYLDCGLTYNGAPATTISGLDHLEGQTVQILADGAVQPERTVTGGQIVLERAASIVQIGLGTVARLVPMRLEAGSRNGTSQGKIKRVNSLTARFIDTLGGKAGMYGSRLDDIQLRAPSTPMGQASPIYSGDHKIDIDGDYETDCWIEIRQDQPLPMTVAALMPQVATYDP